MRSKEVDGAIKQLKSNASYCVTSIETTKTVLSYIKTLEQLPNKIRDKIKELDKNELLGKMNFEQVKFAIDILKSIIEGEK